MAFMSSERRDKGEELMSQEVGRSLPTPVIISFFKAHVSPPWEGIAAGGEESMGGVGFVQTHREAERERQRQADRQTGRWLALDT